MNQFFKYVYEALMVLLVIITIVTLWTDHTYNTTVNVIVWLVFFIDFIVRLFSSKSKWNFIKSNPFLLIAIIPVDQFFQIARIVRIFYLFRIKTIAKFYILPYALMLTYRALGLILASYIIILLGISVAVLRVEEAITTLKDAIFVVFGHLLFFGHRIFIIEHMMSVSLLTIVSISGVIIQGLALQWVLSKGEFIFRKIKHERSSNAS